MVILHEDEKALRWNLLAKFSMKSCLIKFLWVLQQMPMRHWFVGSAHFPPMTKFFACGVRANRHAAYNHIFMHDWQK